MKMMVAILLLFVMVSALAVAADDPVTIVRRTYGWHLVPKGDGTLTYASYRKDAQELVRHEADFSPKLFALLRAVDQMADDYRAGRIPRLTWDTDPLTCTESATFTPLKLRLRSTQADHALVDVASTVTIARTFKTSWQVELVQASGRWRIDNVRFGRGKANLVDMLTPTFGR